MLLKIGSTGNNVKLVQEFLGIKADGIFGKITEDTIKKWQIKNGAIPNGIIDTKVWNSMGLATTDLTEQIPDSNNINIKRNYLPHGEYFVGPTKKEWIFLHHTAGWENPYNVITAWAKDDRGSIATEFVIGGQKITNGDSRFDGEIVQAFPEGGYGWHLGVGNTTMHRNSVGIELCNFGWLKNGRTYVNTIANQSQVVTLDKPFRGYNSWHRYSDKQISALKNTILFIAERDSIDPRAGLPALIKKHGIGAFDICDPKMCERTKGLWSHTNAIRGKFDVFPQKELVDMLLSL